ncbi:hypothetical protein FGK63_01765 [Ruegeria sediminis]|uniref:Mu-like prophage FluMu N-terminal domain-containing protein n=1 Tax=Ruegeria sediminis TaxID=2583820 RepID=A0ABY2X4U3_9RHOB|nr:hypothetical protein [Ruegeria sediminis]TMV09822.1 hypothetical protein FGK63_01765 [Ruegeria sediminis]
MSERDTLKAQAVAMGLDFAGNIPTAKLKALIDEAMASKGDTQPSKAAAEAAAETGQKPQAGAGKAPATQPPAGDLVVEVVGPKKGRWRIGRHFTADPVVIPLDELSEDEKAALIADPKLSVTTRAADPE